MEAQVLKWTLASSQRYLFNVNCTKTSQIWKKKTPKKIDLQILCTAKNTYNINSFLMFILVSLYSVDELKWISTCLTLRICLFLTNNTIQ